MPFYMHCTCTHHNYDKITIYSDLESHFTEAIEEKIARQKQTLKEVSSKNQVRVYEGSSCCQSVALFSLISQLLCQYCVMLCYIAVVNWNFCWVTNACEFGFWLGAGLDQQEWGGA